ncbi:3-phosphoshikimate 1-carboxyvinyltransferase [Tepidanaerobacter acetatoxydans Re1]|uniref:3-phosphoshikimate 1-carboxyvinyltransferase n=1 Tax=Tepidanaerobacter acetatoxydans (strain DSM 21804 / JCM 16047 / Re1) TaxID=1209989 RepID=F4LTX6_TEPAE|nr:3-phosphoshikimate 1-carboxyvinyltransferase [Tepidanaerobacter acetatoxydans]AEE92573.1 3-phosphoshikimate 1-carboxyvinyltransferase [Tepidanaerobacter acetatoxydans Re1]CCP27527.1 3-phosphoshikimate 1-carboxyvinyltransferase [Tepidanaerobacter acetatoxydans Re1]
MKNLEVSLPFPNGEVFIPPSKSISHRMLICAGLAEGESILQNIAFSDDIIATKNGIKAFGAKIRYLGNYISDKANDVAVKGIKLANIRDNLTIDCKESGSTLRFLIPIALAYGKQVTFIGRGRLFDRPLDVFYDVFRKHGINYFMENDKPSLTVAGKLKPDTFNIKGNVSSQFISGLLFALPLLEGDSLIITTTPVESKAYIDLTIDALKRFDVKVENQDYEQFSIKGRQIYKAADCRVEGDFSQGAFWLAAGVLGGSITCFNLDINSHQGDKYIVDIIRKMGAQPVIGKNFIKVEASNTHGVTVDAAQCPDLVPIVAVLGALSRGTTQILNAGRLRIKESDRLKAISLELSHLGAKIVELADGLIIEGRDMLDGGIVDSWNDHRIAMALAVASVRCRNPVIIKHSDAVSKSYPGFWKDFIKLGGVVDEFDFRA